MGDTPMSTDSPYLSRLTPGVQIAHFKATRLGTLETQAKEAGAGTVLALILQVAVFDAIPVWRGTACTWHLQPCPGWPLGTEPGAETSFLLPTQFSAQCLLSPHGRTPPAIPGTPKLQARAEVWEHTSAAKVQFITLNTED